MSDVNNSLDTFSYLPDLPTCLPVRHDISPFFLNLVCVKSFITMFHQSDCIRRPVFVSPPVFVDSEVALHFQYFSI